MCDARSMQDLECVEAGVFLQFEESVASLPSNESERERKECGVGEGKEGIASFEIKVGIIALTFAIEMLIITSSFLCRNKYHITSPGVCQDSSNIVQ